MVVCRNGISLLMFNSTSHSFVALTRELRAPMYYSLFIELDDSESKRCVKVDGYEISIYNTDFSYLPLT